MNQTTIPKTLFRQNAESHQDTEERTVSAKAGHGAVLIVIGSVSSIVLYFFPALAVLFPFIGWAGYIIGRIVGSDMAPLVIAITIITVKLICFAGILYGAAKLISAWRANTKSLKCPRCGSSFEVFTKVTKAMCPSCGLLVLPGESQSPNLRLVECAYCGLKTAASPDCLTYRCSNCGVSRTGITTPGIQDKDPCPFCGNLKPTEATLCLYCNNTIKQTYHNGKFLDSFNMDWLIGKDATGHYHFSKGLLTSINANASGAKGLDELAICWADLETALISMEEAGCNGAEQAVIEDLIPQLEAVYGSLLEKELRIIEGDANKKYEKGKLKISIDEPYLKARRRIEERFSEAIPSALRWNDKLLEVTETATGKHVVKNYSRLKDEFIQHQHIGSLPIGTTRSFLQEMPDRLQSDAADRLRQLLGLRNENLISQEEYEQKRKEVLEKLGES